MNIHTLRAAPAKLGSRLRTVPGLLRDTAAFAAVAVLGIATTAIILTNENYTWPWQSHYTVIGEFSEAVAVSPGNGQEVRIAGVPVGKIEASEPTDHHTSRVTLFLDDVHQAYDNASLVLRPKNPLNEMYVEMNPGGPPGKPLPDGATVALARTARPVQPEEALNHLDDRARRALSSLLEQSDMALADAPRDLPAGLDATDSTLTRIRPVVQSLAQRRDRISQLVTAFSDLSAGVGHDDQRLASLLDSTQQTLGVLARRDRDAGTALERLPGATGELRKAMDTTTRLTGTANPLLDNVKRAAGDLPPALGQVQTAAQSLAPVIRAAQPVVAKAQPLLRDLRPVVDRTDDSLGDLRPVTHQLDYATAQVAPWMHDLGAFVYNTNSIMSGKDINGAFGRGHLTLNLGAPTSIPSGHSDDKTTGTYQQGGSPLGSYPAPGEPYPAPAQGRR